MVSRILVCGDRNWTGQVSLDRFLDVHAADAQVVIHGCARGADTLGGLWASKRGKEILPFPAQWSMYGRAAGPIRNQAMLDRGKPELVIAFHSNIAASKGTKDMLARAKRAGIPTLLCEKEFAECPEQN